MYGEHFSGRERAQGADAWGAFLARVSPNAVLGILLRFFSFACRIFYLYFFFLANNKARAMPPNRTEVVAQPQRPRAASAPEYCLRQIVRRDLFIKGRVGLGELCFAFVGNHGLEFLFVSADAPPHTRLLLQGLTSPDVECTHAKFHLKCDEEDKIISAELIST